METKEEKKSAPKTKVYNVIILDRSGSMFTIRQAAIDGFNETLNGIKKAQEKFGDTQEHYVSLLTFCSCSMQQVMDKVPAAEARQLTLDDYAPCCCTPLYDAMGQTLTAMHRHVSGMDDVAVVVTIITDGIENDSHEYTAQSIKMLVSMLRTEGWSFTYMGANQDAESVAQSLNIRNARNFEYNSDGAHEAMRKDTSTRMNYFQRLWGMRQAPGSAEMSASERRKCYSKMADEAFDEEESK